MNGLFGINTATSFIGQLVTSTNLDLYVILKVSKKREDAVVKD
jgi:hypothetical protein